MQRGIWVCPNLVPPEDFSENFGKENTNQQLTLVILFFSLAWFVVLWTTLGYNALPALLVISFIGLQLVAIGIRRVSRCIPIMPKALDPSAVQGWALILECGLFGFTHAFVQWHFNKTINSLGLGSVDVLVCPNLSPYGYNSMGICCWLGYRTLLTMRLLHASVAFALGMTSYLFVTRFFGGVQILELVAVFVGGLLILVCKRVLENAQISLFLTMQSTKQAFVEEKVLRFAAEHDAISGPFSRKAGESPEPRYLGARQEPQQDQEAEQDESSITTSTGHLSSNIFEESHLPLSIRLAAIAELAEEEHWLIDAKNLELFPDIILGRGSFGMTLAGRLLGTPVAMKVQLFAGTDATRLLSITNELRMLRRLRHQNIVIFYGACILGEEILLVEELLDGLRLTELITDSPKPAWHARVSIIDDICQALQYLHGLVPAIVHGDLTPNNIIVTRLYMTKLLDFGLSRLGKPNAAPLGGTLQWVAPEVIDQSNRVPVVAADIFSFGRVIAFVVSQASPLIGFPEQEIIRMVQDKSPTFVELTCIDEIPLPGCFKLCQECLAWEPDSRPSAAAARVAILGWSSPCTYSLYSEISHRLPRQPASQRHPGVPDGEAILQCLADARKSPGEQAPRALYQLSEDDVKYGQSLQRLL